MKQQITKNNLYYTNEDNLNYLIPKIIKLAQTKYKYAYDSTKGINEYWLFPFETQHFLKQKIGVDCEDWSILIASYFESAKIPTHKYFISAGWTRNNFGHATIYFNYKNNWYHINSTTKHKKNKLTDFPLKNDKTDLIGIKENGFWFSFNKHISVSKFEIPEELTKCKILYDEIEII
jgi:hypothetical protein